MVLKVFFNLVALMILWFNDSMILFSRMKNPSCLSPPLCGRCSSPLIISMSLCWASFTKLMPLARTGHSTPNMALTMLSRGKWSPPSAFWQWSSQCSPGCWMLVFDARSHCWLVFNFLPTSMHRCFSSKLFSRWLSPGCAGVWSYFFPRAGVCTSLCWTLWDSHQQSNNQVYCLQSFWGYILPHCPDR